MRLTVRCSPPSGIPTILWRFIARRPELWAVGGRRYQLDWRDEVTVELPDSEADVVLTYPAASWGAGSKAAFGPRDGQRVRYRARLLPWRRGSIDVDMGAGERSAVTVRSSAAPPRAWSSAALPAATASWLVATAVAAFIAGGFIGGVIALLGVLGAVLVLTLGRSTRQRRPLRNGDSLRGDRGET